MELNEFFNQVNSCEPYYARELKTKVTQGAPKFDLEKWKHPAVRKKSNCLTVAMDLVDRGESVPGFLRMPAHIREYEVDSNGEYEGRPYISSQTLDLSALFVETGLKHDGLTRIQEHGGHENDHILAMFFMQSWSEKWGDEVDFHPYTRTKEGIWVSGQVHGERHNRDVEIEACDYAGLLERFLGEEAMLKRHASDKGYMQFLGFHKMPDEFEYYPDPELVKLELEG